MKQSYRILLSCLLLSGALVFLHFRSFGQVVPINKPLELFPLRMGDWQGQEGSLLGAQELSILQVRDYLMRRYVDETGQMIWLYIGYWDTQRRGAQMHSPKHCLPGGGWEPLEARRVSIPLVSAPDTNGDRNSLDTPHKTIQVNHYVLQKDQAQQVVLYWYQAQGQVVASEIDAKLQLVKNAVLHNRTDGALIRLSSPVRGTPEATFARQLAYVQALYPVLAEFLPE